MNTHDADSIIDWLLDRKQSLKSNQFYEFVNIEDPLSESYIDGAVSMIHEVIDLVEEIKRDLLLQASE